MTNLAVLSGIAFDIDGVIADVMAPIRNNCKIIFKNEYHHDLETGYDLTEALGLTDRPELVEGYVNWCLHQIDEIPIDSYAIKLTEALFAFTGKAIPFVTHRHREPMMSATYELIESFITVPYTISFAGGTKYQSGRKDRYIPKGYQFVEDRRATAIELSNEGILCWLIRTKYNRLERTQKNSKILLVNDLREIYEFYFEEV